MPTPPAFNPNAAYSVPAFDPNGSYQAGQVNAVPNLTSNPNREGTYGMVGRSGPVQIPYSNVSSAREQGYMFSGSDADRYAKDFAATQHPIIDFIDSKFANNPGEGQPGGYDEALRPIGNIGRRAVRSIAHTMSSVGDSLLPEDTQKAGEKQFNQSLMGRIAAGENPSNAEILADQADQIIPGLPLGSRPLEAARTAKSQGPMQAATDLAGDALALYAGGKAVKAVIKAASPTPPVSGQNYTQAHAAAFEGAIAPAASMGKNFIPQNVSPEALTPIRSTAARMAQGTPVEQGVVRAATSSSTPPLERIAAYQNIVQTALDDLESQHAPALARAANIPVNTAPIVQRLRGLISPTMAPADVAAINELVSRVQQASTIGDLNTFRRELNIETSPEYRQSQVQAGRSGVSSQATSDLAGWVRNAYYDNLQQVTGTDFAPLKRQEANLITTQEALQNQQAPLARAEATYNAPSTLRETAGDIANVIKDPKTTVTQTILRESPSTKVATLLKKSLDDLPGHTPPPPPPAPPSQIGAPPPQPALGRGPVPTVQGTQVNPFSAPGPRGLPTPNTPQLPATTGGYIPTPASPPPPFDSGAARMRVQPTQFTQPEAAPSRGAITVSPAGDATLPAKGLPAPEAGTPKAPSPTGKALWAQKGAEKMATHGVSASDVDALSKTPKGRQLLVIASDLTPGSAAMKNLVRQIPAVLGK